MTNSSDDDRFDEIYMANRDRGTRLAARFIKKMAQYPSLVGLEAEGIYDQALHKYYVDGTYREEHDDHWPLLHHRITQAGLDALKKAKAKKRIPTGRLVSRDETTRYGTPRHDLLREEPTELDQALNRAAISEARAKAIHAADGNRTDAQAVDAAYAYHAEKQTHQEIAGEQGISEETARRRVKRGTQLLADQLEADNSGRRDSP